MQLIYSGFLNRDSEIISPITRYDFELVAIDAPLSLPEGLCCLEESCPCQPKAEGKSRSCEQGLRKQGISVFPVTKRTFIKKLIYRGIKLKTELEYSGYKVIEVYPYASKIRLFGNNIPKKSTRDGLLFLKQHIGRLLPGITPYVARFNDDMCDAAIAAYTAYLHYKGKTELCGNPAEGLVWLPSLRPSG